MCCSPDTPELTAEVYGTQQPYTTVDSTQALANATLLVHPKPNAPLNIIIDASDIAIGAVLQKFLDDKWCPLSHFSRKLSPTEQQYSTFDRKLLAVYCVIHHFLHFLEAYKFHVLTDHKPLTHSLQSNQIGIDPTKYVTWSSSHNSLVTLDTWLEKVTQ